MAVDKIKFLAENNVVGLYGSYVACPAVLLFDPSLSHAVC